MVTLSNLWETYGQFMQPMGNLLSFLATYGEPMVNPKQPMENF